VHSPVTIVAAAIVGCTADAWQYASVSRFAFFPGDAGGYWPLDTEDERIPFGYGAVILQSNNVKHTRISVRHQRQLYISIGHLAKMYST
jgi:hypothetical protein